LYMGDLPGLKPTIGRHRVLVSDGGVPLAPAPMRLPGTPVDVMHEGWQGGLSVALLKPVGKLHERLGEVERSDHLDSPALGALL
jgi:hypothetical protein